MALHVEIVTPTRVAWEGEADQVEAPGWDGEFGVLPQHAPMLALTRPGVVVVHQGSATQKLVVGRGFAEVGPDRVVLLVDSFEPAGEVDKAAAQAQLSAANAVLGSTAAGSAEHEAAERDAALARARLSV